MTQINGISFSSPYSGVSSSVLERGKLQAKKYLDSYIEQINEFSEIQNSLVEEKERFFEQENKNLKSRLMEVISSSNKNLEDRNELLSDINVKNVEIKKLKENTVQLNEITINKLFGLIKNLPIGQAIGLFTALFGIIGFSYWLGTTIKENSFLKSEYELQTKINELNFDKQNLDNNIFKLKAENNNLKQEIEKLDNKKVNTNTKVDSINKCEFLIIV
ncbi:peptidoglycan hydrolase CwlO-like protein [Flavobacterium sp. CG_9.1]|uniref:hypothetical protein n=1 Tax=Flavobacterium sp. CG_9.1 TaxID=2787728 RepID=UPI0018CB900D|nr:hypothetical protein [Flavobacterium sp. CG_9.1]MBG6063442.1 peptidoglycan hydrolase CwlO-like protein [Flavobacterium sp. CG_9.1]